MAVAEFWGARLENWALWLSTGSRTGSVGISGIYRGERGYEDRATLPTPLIGEASDTDRLIGKLSADHQAALRAWFLWSGTTDERARALGVAYTTWRERVIAARYRLDDLYHARKRPANCAESRRSRVRGADDVRPIRRS